MNVPATREDLIIVNMGLHHASMHGVSRLILKAFKALHLLRQNIYCVWTPHYCSYWHSNLNQNFGFIP